MHAAVLHSFGDTPRFEPFTEPAAGSGEHLVEVSAAALHRVDRARASGQHYASAGALPVVCGTDGVGVTPAGERVWFALPRAPFGAMAQRTVADRRMQAPIPDGLSDAEAAALVNPGMAAYLPLQWRARLQPGETVLVLGATGFTGRLAVQVARLLGAGRVVAAGRDPHGLEELTGLGADTVIGLGDDPEAMRRSFAAAAGDGYDVVVDYVWGAPTEALLASMLRAGFAEAAGETRIVQVGDLAGPQLRLPS
jgi:NADPH:quinone reductase-like Zn-dependent oxidoreductase